MKKGKWIMLVILILLPAVVYAQDRISDKSAPDVHITISGQEFTGFDRCKISKKLSDTKTKLMMSGKPLKKEENAWTYAIRSEVMGLPVKSMTVGVCNATGDQACGWSSFIAVIIAKPFKETKNHLKQKTGIDFTIEKRSKEAEITLRPVLRAGEKSDESILFCDPGIL